MRGNTTHRFADTTVLSVCTAEPSVIVASADLDGRLEATHREVRLRTSSWSGSSASGSAGGGRTG